MNEFKINQFITLKLENGKTFIYVKGKRFSQCKFLLLHTPLEEIHDLELNSIDQMEEILDNSLEEGNNEIKISPESEFWGHCSNMQVWFENDYDTRLLHRNLAFPLLRKLTEMGDMLAKKVFKEEIIKRLSSGYPNTVYFLSTEGYLNDFEEEEWEIICADVELEIVKNILRSIASPPFYADHVAEDRIVKLIKNSFKKSQYTRNIVRKEVYELFKFEEDNVIAELLFYNFIEILDREDIISLFSNQDSKLKENLLKIITNKASKYSTNESFLLKKMFFFLFDITKKTNYCFAQDLIENVPKISKIKIHDWLLNRINRVDKEQYLTSKYGGDYIKELKDFYQHIIFKIKKEVS